MRVLGDKGNVYLLSDPSTNLCKIGMTRGSVEKRMKALQTGNSCEICLLDQFATEIPTYIESRLHRYFQEKQSLNEWYDLSDEDIRDFGKICKNFEDIARALQGNPFFKYKLSD